MTYLRGRCALPATPVLVPLLAAVAQLPAQESEPAPGETPTAVASFASAERCRIDGEAFVRRDARASAFAASSQESVALAARGDGEVAVAWVSRCQQGGYSGVYLQRFDRAGRRRGDETPIRPAPGHHQQAPSLAWDGEALWAAWQQDDERGRPACYLRRMVPEPTAPIRIGRDRSQAIALAARRGGGLAVVWEQQGKTGPRPWLELRTASGERARAPIPLAERGRLPRAVALDEDHLAVAWATDEGIALAVVAAGKVKPVELKVPASAVEPSLARSGGGVALAWHEPIGGGRWRVGIVHWDGKHAPTAPSYFGAGASGAAVAAVAGHLALVWNEGSDVLVAVGHGSRWSRPRRATLHAGGSQRLTVAGNRATAALLPDGTLVAAWTGDGGLGDSSAAHVSWLAPASAARADLLADDHPDLPRPVDAPEPPDPLPTGLLVPDPPSGGMPHPQTRGVTAEDGTGFVGITDTGWKPPDPQIAAGPDHVVAVVNGGLAFFRKDGTRTHFQDLAGPNGLWGPVGSGSYVFDPRVLFDTDSGRFYVSAGEQQGTSRGYLLLAVSDDDDPNGTWYRYRFDISPVIGGYFVDFPHLGFNRQTVFLAATAFFSRWPNVLCALPKPALLAGQQVTPATWVGQLDRPALGAQSEPGSYVYSVEAPGNRRLRVQALQNQSGTIQLTGHDVAVPAYADPGLASQPGTTQPLDPTDSRLCTLAHRDGRIWCAHTVGTPPRVRWYELDIAGWPGTGVPRLVQTGELMAEGAETILPSIAADIHGNAVICATRTGPNALPTMVYYQHRDGDPPGTMAGPVPLRASPVSYTTTFRWGDYCGACVDPRDGATFWLINEVAVDPSTWQTWIEPLRLEPPTLRTDTSVLSARLGGTVTFTLDNGAYASRGYLMLGSASGTTPGFRLPTPPSVVNLDLNPDAFMFGAASLAGSPTFPGFSGKLDAVGRATARMVLPPLPFLTGTATTLYFAYAQDGSSWTFASESVSVVLN